MVHGQEDAPRRYPGPPFYDEALAWLHDSEQDGEIHIPTFARRTLKRLQDVGLLHTPDDEPPVNIRKVKLVKEGKEQELWIRFDTRRTHAGYMAIDVVDAPRSDAAILAAMTAWVAQRIDFNELLEAMGFLHSRTYEEQVQRTDDTHRRIVEGQEVSVEELIETIELSLEHTDKLKTIEPLEYIVRVIQHYKPEFDSYPPEKQWALIRKTCSYISDFLESLRKLQAFLEYGAPDRKLVPAIREPQRAVRAAVLYDVDGLNYREIGERMGIPLPPDYEIKGEHQTVRKMVERGREILQEAFGEEGWRERVEAMKGQKAWWWSLSKKERDYETNVEMTALDLGISIEEARRRI